MKKETENKLLSYYRIRDIVQYVYSNYVLREMSKYGDEVDGEMLAEECILLVLDVLNNKPHLSDDEISTLAVKEAHIKRMWHKN